MDPDENPDVEQVLGRTVYEETWKEFYKWERQECLNILASLSKDHPIEAPPSPKQSRIDVTDDAGFDLDMLGGGDGDGPECFIVEEYDENEDPVRYSTFGVFEGYMDAGARGFLPYPSYTFCTPASQNYAQPDHHGYALDFLPFADDPLFPVEKYLACFSSFSWQADFIVPDCKCRTLLSRFLVSKCLISIPQHPICSRADTAGNCYKALLRQGIFPFGNRPAKDPPETAYYPKFRPSLGHAAKGGPRSRLFILA